ncbi:hypothetical protein [Methanococcoides burtonii]|uniref:hypothetical protein n=1 Tax=Methanococcoides burtonii TaxID=29291 RepID=UPI0018DC8999|nr:hypothetical protein [Methanococcoides burtonii]
MSYRCTLNSNRNSIVKMKISMIVAMVNERQNENAATMAGVRPVVVRLSLNSRYASENPIAPITNADRACTKRYHHQYLWIRGPIVSGNMDR